MDVVLEHLDRLNLRSEKAPVLPYSERSECSERSERYAPTLDALRRALSTDYVVWLLDLRQLNADAAREGLAYLEEATLERLRRYHHPERFVESLGARLLATLAARLTHTALCEDPPYGPVLLDSEAPTGQPRLRYLSVSHTHQVAAIAIAPLAGERVGLDIEWERPRERASDILEHILPEAVVERIRTHVPHDSPGFQTLFYRAWCESEALIKLNRGASTFTLVASLPNAFSSSSVSASAPSTTIATALSAGSLSASRPWDAVRLDDQRHVPVVFRHPALGLAMALLGEGASLEPLTLTTWDVAGLLARLRETTHENG